jgi:uncharacterized membrane protein
MYTPALRSRTKQVGSYEKDYIQSKGPRKKSREKQKIRKGWNTNIVSGISDMLVLKAYPADKNPKKIVI